MSPSGQQPWMTALRQGVPLQPSPRVTTAMQMPPLVSTASSRPVMELMSCQLARPQAAEPPGRDLAIAALGKGGHLAT